ncbi:MAG TPA: autotransporter domain-containing protein [Xanthobacteraceae bacterium]|jgi:outer membrane lipase/esterase
MKPRSILLAAVASLLFTPSAEAQGFNQFFAFGDSTTDTGWFAHASTGIPAIDALVANSLAQGGNAHFTGPGPGNAQILAGFFGLSANAANTPGGTNYAIGGALDNSALGPGLENLFTAFTGPNPSLPGTATQIQNYLTSVNGHANPNALYLIGSGGNDATLAALLFSSPAQANAFLLAEASALVSSVAQLRAAGGHYIVVTDEYAPPSADATQVAYGKTLLNATWRGLAGAGVNFIPADTLSVVAVVEKNPLMFGITAPTTSNACIKPAAWPFDSGYGFLCAPTTTPSPNYGYLVSADATQTHLYMDGTHLTQAGQLIVADYIYSLIVAPSEISYLAEAPVKTRATVINTIDNQIAVSLGQPGIYHAWVSGDVSWLKMTTPYSGFPDDPGTPVAAVAGFDFRLTPNWLLGVAFSTGRTKQTFSLGGDYTLRENAVSGYAAYLNGPFWGNIVISEGSLHYDTNRQVPIGITVQPNYGSTSGSNPSLFLETGYNFTTPLGYAYAPYPTKTRAPVAAFNLVHGPVAGITFQRVKVDGFAETDAFAALGGFTALSFSDQTRKSAVSELGYKATMNIGYWQPFAKLVWNHEMDPNTDRQVTAFLTTSTVAPGYSLPAVYFGRNWGSASVGTGLKLAQNVTAYAAFDSQFAEHNLTIYGGQVGLNIALDPLFYAPAPLKAGRK